MAIGPTTFPSGNIFVVVAVVLVVFPPEQTWQKSDTWTMTKDRSREKEALVKERS